MRQAETTMNERNNSGWISGLKTLPVLPSDLRRIRWETLSLMTRQLSIVFMLRGLITRIRRVRVEVDQEAPVTVRSRLWNAEMQLRKAEEAMTSDGDTEPSQDNHANTSPEPTND